MIEKIIILSFMILSSNLFTQNYNEEFRQICKKGKISESKDFFENWEKSEPENPEMFVGLFNYYYALSTSKMGEPNFLGGYLISEKDSINIKEINKTFNESDSLFNLAQGYLIRGINENKDRLDMYLGRSATLKDKGISSEFLESIKSIVIRNNLNQGKWLWSNNQPIEKTEDEFVNMIQTYINSMFQTSNPKIKAILEITEITLKKYPDNYILLTNKGLCMAELGKHKEAILYFKQGLKSNPSDMIIRFNLADSYVQLKKIKEAKNIYNYIIENGGDQYAQYAKDILNKVE